MSLLPL